MAKQALEMTEEELVAVRSVRSLAKGPGKALNFRVDPEFYKKFKMLAAKRGLKLSELLVLLLETFEKETAE